MRVLLLAFPIFLFWLNHLSPYMPGDDYMFMMKVPTDAPVGMERIESLSDFLESQSNIFHHVHYRYVVHCMLQFLLLLPPFIFDFANTFIFLWIARLLIPGSYKQNRFEEKYLVSCLFLFCFHPDLANAYFWTTGSVNYSWTLIPLLYYMRSFCDYVDHGQGINKLLFLSPFVACTNENALLSLFLMTGLVLAYELISEKRINAKLVMVCFIMLVGGLVMIYSPSATDRLAREGFFYDNLGYRLLEYLKRTLYYLMLYLPLGLIPLLIRAGGKRIRRSHRYLIGMAALSLLVMFLVPLFEQRSCVFGFVILMYLFFSKFAVEGHIRPLLLGLLIFYSAHLVFNRIQNFGQIHHRVADNVRLLKSAEKHSDVKLQRQCPKYALAAIRCYDIDEHPSYINQSLANYYGMKSVSLLASESKKENWQGEQNEIRGEGLKNYREVQKGLFLKNENNKLHVVLKLNPEESKDNSITTIIRGHRDKSVKHDLASVLPYNLQLYFLDFLEYTGTYYKDGKSTHHKAPDGQMYAYHLIFDYDTYDYLLVSRYSMNNHTAYGDVIRVDL